VEEAVTIRRALTESQPEAFLPHLAMSLNNQAVFLLQVGRHEKALAAIEEAVTINGGPTAALPVVFSDGHADSLENPVRILLALGRESEAQPVIKLMRFAALDPRWLHRANAVGLGRPPRTQASVQPPPRVKSAAQSVRS
jgi:tetratricopeptide (TPR) repeat protein